MNYFIKIFHGKNPGAGHHGAWQTQKQNRKKCPGKRKEFIGKNPSEHCLHIWPEDNSKK